MRTFINYFILLTILQFTFSSCKKEVDEANPDFIGTWTEADPSGNDTYYLVIHEDSYATYYKIENNWPVDYYHELATGKARSNSKKLVIGGTYTFKIDKKPTQLGPGSWIMTLDGKDYVGSGPRPKGEYCDDGIQNQDETGIDCGGSCGSCFETFRFEVEGEGVYNIPNDVGASYDSAYSTIDPRWDHESFGISAGNKIYESNDISVYLQLFFHILPDGTISMTAPDTKSSFTWSRDSDWHKYMYDSGTVTITSIDKKARIISLNFDLIFKEPNTNITRRLKYGEIKNLHY